MAQSYAEAVKWLRKAAEQGDAKAKRNLEIISALPLSNGETYSLFFPVFGIQLGQSTVSDVESLGYCVEKQSSGSYVAHINSIFFWDHDGNGVFKHIYMTVAGGMPERWEELGFNWRLSYDEWLMLFQKMDFTVEHKSLPKTIWYSRRRTLSALFVATAPDQSFEMELDFDYGNDNGEGCKTKSKGSLYSISVRKK